jgi:hypothetical protein
MPKNLTSLLFPLAALAIGLGGGWYMSNSKLIKPFSSDDANSPIIISDGSVHFHQHFRWNVKDSSHIDANIDGNAPKHIKWAVCTPNADGSVPKGSCTDIQGYDLVALGATSFSVFLCKPQMSGPPVDCSAGDAGLFTQLDWDSSSNTSDVAVNSNPSGAAMAPFTFGIDAAVNGDGAGLLLCETGGTCTVTLRRAGLKVNGITQPLGACAAVSPQKCVIKIRYCSTSGAGCTGST